MAQETTVDIPLAWWSTFCEEPIVRCLDEKADPGIAELVALEPVKVTKAVRRVVLTPDLLGELWSQADWYSYYWGELASGAWDNAERMYWLSKQRSSKALARRLRVMLDTERE
jgi:hypothetical protein